MQICFLVRPNKRPTPYNPQICFLVISNKGPTPYNPQICFLVRSNKRPTPYNCRFVSLSDLTRDQPLTIRRFVSLSDLTRDQLVVTNHHRWVETCSPSECLPATEAAASCIDKAAGAKITHILAEILSFLGGTSRLQNFPLMRR